MSEGDFLDDRRRASEDDYFRKKDRELVEKMRAAAAADRAKSEMSAKTGLSDPSLLAELEALGFTPETISVLPLVPIVEMAWAEGGITPAERTLLVTLARERSIAEGSAGRSTTVGLDGSTALARCLRARHPAHPGHARHGCAGEREAERRRPHQVQREHRGGFGGHPRHRQNLVGGARDARQNRDRAQDRAVSGARDILAARSTCSRAAARSPSIRSAPHTPRPGTPLTASVLKTSRHRRRSGR